MQGGVKLFLQNCSKAQEKGGNPHMTLSVKFYSVGKFFQKQ